MRMCSDQNWDIEALKAEHECDDHWELRRSFMLAHKDKFPEDELVCLAQVFVNVELLGCKYPDETMDIIDELGRDIADSYRKKQKNRLQRTFVKASNAASLKIQGKAATSTDQSERDTKAKESSADSDIVEVPVKRRKVEDLPYGDIVVIERSDDIPQNRLACAVNASGGNLDWKFERVGDSCKCTILVNSKLLAEATGVNQKSARKEASIVGLEKLRKYYYTIKIKHNIITNANVTTTTMRDASKEDTISDDNIGKKLMKLMGWTGGGLGKSQQGIVEPVTIKQQISRGGLGLKSNSFSMYELKKKSKDIMRKYLSGDMQENLVFSADFTNEERAAIHQVARQMGLKSQSYGPKNQRTMVVSRKIDVRDLVEELKSFGGVTSKYELIEPTGL